MLSEDARRAATKIWANYENDIIALPVELIDAIAQAFTAAHNAAIEKAANAIEMMHRIGQPPGQSAAILRSDAIEAIRTLKEPE